MLSLSVNWKAKLFWNGGRYSGKVFDSFRFYCFVIWGLSRLWFMFPFLIAVGRVEWIGRLANDHRQLIVACLSRSDFVLGDAKASNLLMRLLGWIISVFYFFWCLLELFQKVCLAAVKHTLVVYLAKGLLYLPFSRIPFVCSFCLLIMVAFGNYQSALARLIFWN